MNLDRTILKTLNERRNQREYMNRFISNKTRKMYNVLSVSVHVTPTLCEF